MNWLAKAAEYLGGFPDSYLVIDVETLGRDPKSPDTLLLEFGYCLVEGREVVANDAFLLDWTREPGIDQDHLREQLDLIQRELRQNGFDTDFVSYEDLAQGASVQVGLEEILGVVQTAKEDELPIVGHNFLNADAPVIQRHLWKRLGATFRFQAWEVIDTGLLEKGRLMEIDVPDAGKSIEQWYNAIAKRYSKVKWNLGQACREEYQIPVAPGTEKKFHRGDFDCLFNHKLLEAMRARAEVQQVQRS